jgi:hypothetical protein
MVAQEAFEFNSWQPMKSTLATQNAKFLPKSSDGLVPGFFQMRPSQSKNAHGQGFLNHLENPSIQHQTTEDF